MACRCMSIRAWPEQAEIAFNAGSHTDAVRMPYAEFERLAQPELLWLAHVM